MHQHNDPGEGKKEVSIFDFDTFSEYFAAYVEMQKAVRRNFSLRLLCRRLGIKSPPLLTWISSGKRLPTNEMLHKLSEYIGWRPEEFAYAQALVGLQKASTLVDKDYFAQKLRSLKPTRKVEVLDANKEEIFSKWYLVAILEMSHLADFKADPVWIKARLGDILSVEQVKQALATLIHMGFFVHDADGVLRRNRAKSLRSGRAPSHVIKNFHCDMMSLAQKAIYTQSPQERFFSGITLTIDAEKIAEAQKFLAEFMERFVDSAQPEKGNQTYHFALQFFRLTESISEDSSVEESSETAV